MSRQSTEGTASISSKASMPVPTRQPATNSARPSTASSCGPTELDGMPPVELTRGQDGNLRLNDGVTRATRAAKMRPGELILAEVIATLPNLDVTRTPRV